MYDIFVLFILAGLVIAPIIISDFCTNKNVKPFLIFGFILPILFIIVSWLQYIKQDDNYKITQVDVYKTIHEVRQNNQIIQFYVDLEGNIIELFGTFDNIEELEVVVEYLEYDSVNWIIPLKNYNMKNTKVVPKGQNTYNVSK